MVKTFMTKGTDGAFYYNLSGNADIVMLQSKLIDMGRRVKDFSPAYDRILSLILRHNRQTVLSKGANLGKPWAPLTRRYLLWKERIGASHRGNHLTGELIRQATSRSSGKISAAGVSVSTRGLPYAAFVKFGVQEPGVGRRALMWWGGKLRQDTNNAVLEHLQNAAEEAGLNVR